MSYRNVRVMVTGAGGFLGRWVARLLSEQDADLTLVVRDAAAARQVLRPWDVQGTLIEHDLAGGDIPSLVEEARPDIIFNLAGYGVDPAERDAPAAEALNGVLPAMLASAVAAQPTGWHGARIVHAGSALEYGTADGDLNEATVCRPTTLYGKSKLAGTERLLKTGVAATVARLFTVYGPGEIEGRLLPSLLRAAKSGEALPLTDGLQQRDFAFVADAALGMLRLGAAPSAGVVNLATGILTPVRGFIETAARVLGIPAGQLRFGALPSRPEEMRHDPVSIERLRARAGWTPATGIEAGVAATRDFLKGLE